jgi:hypothetical protein
VAMLEHIVGSGEVTQCSGSSMIRNSGHTYKTTKRFRVVPNTA